MVDYTKEQHPALEGLSREIEQKVRGEVDGPFDLLGQSIGTIMAAQIAARMEPVRCVALMSTFTELNATQLRLATVVMRLTPDWLYRLTAPLAMAYVCGPVGDGGEHPFLAASRSSNKAMVIKRTRWEIGRDFSPDLARITQPTLVLMGKRDRFVPDAGDAFRTLQQLFARPDARVVQVPGGGHVFLPTPAIAYAIRKIHTFLDNPPA